MGESEALVLAKELNGILYADKAAVIMEARRRKIPITSTIIMLLTAKDQGLIENIQKTLDTFIEAGFWLDDTLSHIITGTDVSRGPSVDICHYKALVLDSLKILPIKTLLADAGYDSEESHRFAREDYGMRTIIPPRTGRPTLKLPKGKYRREMKLSFDKQTYGQRWQSETVMSIK